MRKPRDTVHTRPAHPSHDSIADNEIVTKRGFCRRLMIGEKAWREFVGRGLPLIRCGKQVYLDGRAVVAWFRALGEGEGQRP